MASAVVFDLSSGKLLDLRNYISGLTEAGTYPIKLINIPASLLNANAQISNLGDAIKSAYNNNTSANKSQIYFDFSETILPVVEDMPAPLFCTYADAKEYNFGERIVGVPRLQEGVRYTKGLYQGCAITSLPPLPNSLYGMYSMFLGCKHLKTVNLVIPANIHHNTATPNNTRMVFHGVFEFCYSLETATLEFPFPLANLAGNDEVAYLFNSCTSLRTIKFILQQGDLFSNMLGSKTSNYRCMFENCPSLEHIYFPKTTSTPTKQSTFKFWELNKSGTSIAYKITDMDGTLYKSGSITANEYTGETGYKLYNDTDEILFTDSALTDATKNILFTYKKPFELSSSCLDPSKKNFVVWADTAGNTVQNIIKAQTSGSYRTPVYVSNGVFANCKPEQMEEIQLTPYQAQTPSVLHSILQNLYNNGIRFVSFWVTWDDYKTYTLLPGYTGWFLLHEGCSTAVAGFAWVYGFDRKYRCYAIDSIQNLNAWTTY